MYGSGARRQNCAAIATRGAASAIGKAITMQSGTYHMPVPAGSSVWLMMLSFRMHV